MDNKEIPNPPGPQKPKVVNQNKKPRKKTVLPAVSLEKVAALKVKNRDEFGRFKKGFSGNEVYTEEVTLILLEAMYDYLIDTHNVYTLIGALRHVGLPKDWWQQMKNKHKDSETIPYVMEMIEGVIEDRIVNNTMSGTARSAPFSIFLLKNKFNYVDKTEQETKQNINVSNIDLKDIISFEEED